MRNKPSSDQWFLIVAKDGSCQGYMPGGTEEEACKNFGFEVERCFVKRVIKTDEGFIEPNQSEQERLL